jgi:hypothetical protein
MDYTPISARRVLLAFGLTLVVALLPVAFLVLHGGSDGSTSVNAQSDRSPRDMLLVVGSAVLIAAMIGVLVLVISIGRRLARRPARA